MKKLLLIPALMATLAIADQKEFEISPMIGYGISEGNVGFKDSGNAFGGVEVQFNSKNSQWSPEFSVFFSPKTDYNVNLGYKDTYITRGAFNGVYTFDKESEFVPFAKAGMGIEEISNEIKGNEQGFFLDAGIGAKYFFTENLALKAEAVYMAKLSGNHNKYADNNFVATVGLTFAFGDMASEVIPPKKVDTKSVSEPKEEPKHEEPVVTPPVVDGDDDNDGVKNSVDECPNTPADTKVDKFGCAVVKKLVIRFDFDSAHIKKESEPMLDSFADFMKKHKNYRSVITGHADSIGTKAYNKKLSLRRAQAVVDALVARGVEAKRLMAIGMGEEQPIADNSTEEGRAKNRRIEAKLVRIQ